MGTTAPAGPRGAHASPDGGVAWCPSGIPAWTRTARDHCLSPCVAQLVDVRAAGNEKLPNAVAAPVFQADRTLPAHSRHRRCRGQTLTASRIGSLARALHPRLLRVGSLADPSGGLPVGSLRDARGGSG